MVMANTPIKLAQFPLELVVFPQEKLPLHIFEPRYRELVNQCVADDLSFGITPVIDGKLMQIGTEMRIGKIAKQYADGRMDVVTHAHGTYKLMTFSEKTEETSYGMAKVEAITSTGELDADIQQEIGRLITEMFMLMRIPKRYKFDLEADPYALGHKIGMTLEEEYELLCLSEAPARQKYLLKKLERVIPKVKELDQIRRQIEMNGHFRNVIPPKL